MRIGLRSAKPVRFLNFFVCCSLVLVSVPALFTARATPATSSRADKPNLVLIITDDQVANLVPYMPQVQKLLVAEGTSFTQAFVTTPLCCPARSTVLRGQYAHNHGVLNNDGPEGGFPQLYSSGEEASTLATWLRSAGYQTVLLGKYLNAYPYGPARTMPSAFKPPPRAYIPPGWSEWFGFLDVPQSKKFNPYRMYNYRVNQNGRIVRYGHHPEDYQTDVLARLTRGVIGRFSQSSQPFFIYLAPTAPHLPAIPAPRDEGTLLGVKAPRPPSFNEADVSDKPTWLREIITLNPHSVREIDRIFQREREMILALDDLVGGVVETLRARGELKDTYIVFTSDQGFHFGEHRLFRIKLTPYHAATHVPLVIRGPGIEKGQRRKQLVLNTDLAPTLAALGNAEAPGFVDGRSLLPLLGLRPETAAWRQTSLVEFWPRKVPLLDIRDESALSAEVPEYSGLRTKKYLYVEYTYAGGQRERELYDLQKDPYELTNFADRAPKGLLARLEKRLRALKTCRAAGCRKAEAALP